LEKPDWERFDLALSAGRSGVSAGLHIALAQVLASPEGRAGLTARLAKAGPDEWLRIARAAPWMITDARTAAFYQEFSSQVAEVLVFPGRIAAEQVKDTLSTGLASMASDGYLRERAVRRLAASADPFAAPFLAFRTVDNVPATASLARIALLKLSRRNAMAFSQAAPLVGVLRRRKGMPEFAAAFYSVAAGDASLQRVLLASADSATEQAGFELALGAGSLTFDDLVDLAIHSRDTVVSIRAGKAVVEAATEGDPRVVSLLAGRPLLRRCVLDALPATEANVAIGDRLLFDRSPLVRAGAQGILKRAGESAVRIYRAALEIDAKRAIAVWELGYLGIADDLPRLKAALTDPDRRVRRAAATGVARHARADSVPLLVPLLADDAPGVASEAGRQLLQYAGLIDKQILDAAGLSSSAYVRATALRLLRRRSSADRLEADFRALADVDEKICAKGRRDLSDWLGRSASTARRGSLEVRLRLAGLLEPIADTINPETLEAIRFHAGLRPRDLAEPNDSSRVRGWPSQ
jgi:hypothetical protein